VGARHKWLETKLFSSDRSFVSRKIHTMTEATILNPLTFLTQRSGLTTPQFASLGYIEAVPTGCNPDTVIFRKYLSISASVVTLVNGPIMLVMISENRCLRESKSTFESFASSYNVEFRCQKSEVDHGHIKRIIRLNGYSST